MFRSYGSPSSPVTFTGGWLEEAISSEVRAELRRMIGGSNDSWPQDEKPIGQHGAPGSPGKGT